MLDMADAFSAGLIAAFPKKVHQVTQGDPCREYVEMLNSALIAFAIAAVGGLVLAARECLVHYREDGRTLAVAAIGRNHAALEQAELLAGLG